MSKYILLLETLTLPTMEQVATAKGNLTVALAEGNETLTSDRSFTEKVLLTSISAFRYVY